MRRILVGVVCVVVLSGLLIPALSHGESRSDEEAIKAVLLAETDSFFARDYEGWAGTFGEASGAIQIWNNADGSYTHALGSETISGNVRAFMKDHPEPDTTPLFRDNFTFQHFGDAALVTFDKYMGDRKTARPIKEVRVVAKQDGKWKVVCVAAFSDHRPE